MKCKNCGAPRRFGASKCRYCGISDPMDRTLGPVKEENLLNDYKMYIYNNLFGGYTTEFLGDNTNVLGLHPGEIKTGFK